MATPDVTRANQDENMLVFGCVNTFRYKNHRGEVADRKVIPMCVRFGSTKYHPEATWLLECFDLDKNEYRTFVLNDILPR